MVIFLNTIRFLHTITFTNEELNTYMGRCIKLAKKAPPGVGKPHVGALVLSKDKKIVGEEYKTLIEHTSLLIHAERMALQKAGELAKEGYLVTTLEPCVRARRDQIFDSCCELIVERSIQTVVIGSIDYYSDSIKPRSGVAYLQRNLI